MSLYNQILGVHPFAQHLLVILKLRLEDVGRMRDAWVKKDGDEFYIVVFTRNGGGNREMCQSVIDKLKAHANYIKDYDDDYDNTYALIEFSVPQEYKKIVEEIYAVAPEERGMKLFRHVMENLDKGDNPFVKRAMDVGKQIVDVIQKGADDKSSASIIEI